jgi:hypothetical protein
MKSFIPEKLMLCPPCLLDKTKTRLKEKENETATKCRALKILAADAKMRLTDFAYTEQLFRLIQINNDLSILSSRLFGSTPIVNRRERGSTFDR